MEYILETEGLSKYFKKCKAVRHVSMKVKRGAIYGLIGRNGAGKTTLLRMIGGLAIPSEGEFRLFGNSKDESAHLIGRLGLLIEQPGLYPGMNAYENIELKCIALGIKDKELPRRLIREVGLESAGRKKIKTYSMGMKQRLGLALALVGEPDIVILDEPINGLDPQGIAEMRATIERLNKEHHITFIISSHILEELSKIATDYGIIHQGELIEQISKDELLKKCGERIELMTDKNEKALIILERMGYKEMKVVDGNVIHIYEKTDTTGEISSRLSREGLHIKSIPVKNESLEEYFLKLTGGARHA